MLKKYLPAVLFSFVLLFICYQPFAQQRKDTLILLQNIHPDSTSRKNLLSQDTSAKKFNPRKATFRSLLIPGWGQAYNKKYWKIPIIYGALGTTAAIFAYNLSTYKSLRKAYVYISDTIPSNDILIDTRFRTLSAESIRSYRNSFRQNVDYSVLFFLIFWGLNVVDATVDAHLKAFDVSSEISLRIKPARFNNTAIPGLGLVFSIQQKHKKDLSSLQ